MVLSCAHFTVQDTTLFCCPINVEGKPKVVPVDDDKVGDHGVREEPRVRGWCKAQQKRGAADLVACNAYFARPGQGVAWHMWAPQLYLKRDIIPVTKPNDFAITNFVRGVLKWAYHMTHVVTGTRG